MKAAPSLTVLRAVLLLPCGRSDFEVLVEEVEYGLVGADFVGLLGEAVALVVEYHVLDHAVTLAYVLDYLVRLRLDDARVVRALKDYERAHDLVRVEERRGLAQHVELRRGVAYLLVESLAEGLPVGRYRLQRANPVRDAEEVYADRELFGLEGERRQDHVAAVRAARDAYPLRVHVRKSLQVLLRLDAVPQ